MIEVPKSSLRLVGLGLSAFLCSLICFGFLVFIPWDAVALTILGFGLLFLTWAILALYVAHFSPSVAYRFSPAGLYMGDQAIPAFTWDQVKGATLMRGKRRSSVAVILADNTAFNTAGLLPSWLATFLGRPTDKDFALTNMDTSMPLGPFLDLIQTHLDTYGQIKLANLSNKES